MLGACAPQILRACRHLRQCQTRQKRRPDLTDRARGRQAHRRAVRARDQRLAAHERLQRRWQESRPLATELEAWLRTERAKLSRSSPVAEPIDYILKRWDGFTSFLGDGLICLTNNAAERALRGFALGRKAWLLAGSDRGADRAAFVATLITPQRSTT
ncbi:transposase [Mesorhizobium sp. M0077]